MKTISTSFVGLTAILFAGSAFAADVYEPGSYKDSPVSSQASDNPFSGVYFGVQGGGEWIDDEDTGIIGGIHGGYNFSVGRAIVGPYAEINFSNVELRGLEDTVSLQGGILAGVAINDHTLLSGKIGYEFTDLEGDAERRDWVLGGELERMLGQNTSVGLFAGVVIPQEIEVNGEDVKDLIDAENEFRLLGKFTYRP